MDEIDARRLGFSGLEVPTLVLGFIGLARGAMGCDRK